MQSQIQQSRKILGKLLTQKCPSCNICQKKCDSMIPLISYSLSCKYSSQCAHPQIYTQNIRKIDQIMQQAISPTYIHFRDYGYYDDQEENLKRYYKSQQFSKKVTMLSEYYRYHRNLPFWNCQQVDSIMTKYYNRAKDVDYKKIKQVLKKQQGISLTTHKSFSSMDQQSFTKKSRYSNLLSDLNQSSDSLMLKDLCDTIGNALKKVKIQENIVKGTYYSGQAKFQQYLNKQKKRKLNNRKRQQQVQNDKVIIRKNNDKIQQKSIKKFHTKTQQIGLKQSNFPSNHSLKDKKCVPLKSIKNIQKHKEKYCYKQTLKNKLKLINRNQKQKLVTPNETMATPNQQCTRTERNRSAKNVNLLTQVKNINAVSGRTSLHHKEKQNQNFFQNFSSNSKQKKNFGAALKTVRTFNKADAISSQNSERLRKLRSFDKQNIPKQEQYNNDIHKAPSLTRSNSSKQAFKLKMRSSSSHNINIKSNNFNQFKITQNQNTQKKQKINEVIKTARSSSKLNIPICVVKSSLIQLGLNQLKPKNAQAKSLSKQKFKQNNILKMTQKLQRTNSLSKIQPKFKQNHKAGNNIQTQRNTNQKIYNPNKFKQSQSQKKITVNGVLLNSQSKKLNNQKNFMKKKNIEAENIFQKKLTSLKRKQTIF